MDENTVRLQELLTGEAPALADAIVWPQGDRFDRGQRAVELWQQGFAPVIVISGNNRLVGPRTRPGENNVTLSEMRDYLLENDVPARSIVTDNRSLNTRGQAEHVLELAVKRGWQTLILVGSTHAQLRIFLTFLKRAQEIGWTGRLINQSVATPWDAVPGGRQATARELLEEEIIKCGRYSEHVATMAEGLAYFAV